MDDWRLWMDATRNQRTIAAVAEVEGFGYWDGRDVRVRFCPAEEDTGIVFVRDDLPGCPRVAATVDHLAETQRRTNVRCGQASVEMIEHVMAALAGLQIDNCEVWVDQPEMPGCDGSSLPFVEALCGAGSVEQSAVRPRRVIRETIRLGTDRSWIEARPCCSGKTLLQYELDYGEGGPIGRQTREILLSPEAFIDALAASRTFVLESEAAALQAQGLGQRTTFRDLLVFGPDGPIDNRLRFSDECVRHKLLDMVGDLALAGCDLVGRFTAYRSGHRLNAELVRAVLASARQCKSFKRCA
jgi:UDP-3-O-acyl N-acetylglucosamine deacetylase